MGDSPWRLVALDHVQLAMPPGGEAAARAFYVGVLGLVEIPKPAELEGRGGVWFGVEGVELHLGVDPDFRRRFDVMALQRNLKALGTFGYQTATRRNPVYIQYMPRTLRYVRTNLEKYPRLARVRDVLAAHIEELR